MEARQISVDELNQLEEVILNKVHQRTPPRMNEESYINKICRLQDVSSSGFISFDGFKKALLPFTAGLSDQDVRAFFSRYAEDGKQNQHLFYKNFGPEFVSGCRRAANPYSENGGPSDGNANGGVQNQPVEAVEDTLMRLKIYLYSQGPEMIISLASAFRQADFENSRSLSYDDFGSVMCDFFAADKFELTDDQIHQLFEVFQQPYMPNMMTYDEFFFALKEELSPERRACVRAAFRRLDTNSEGLVDMNQMIKNFNASRHPQVADGSREPEDVLSEFTETMKELVAFRRGQRSYSTNLVAWEEFEDYYKMINGCYDTDDNFCATLTRVWSLDKNANAKAEAQAAAAIPAAGVAPKTRTGLHHWQENTLPKNDHNSSNATVVNLDQVFALARAFIARQGLKAAIDVVKNMYDADDDVDDMLDVYEFRRACQQSKLFFKPREEARLFEICGTGPSSVRGSKLPVPSFLELLHGRLNNARRLVVEQSFESLGGDPHSEDSVVSPATLKDSFDAMAHPAVEHGERDPVSVMNEFLDTFSLLAHVRGGCQNGMVAFSDFLAYYEVVSSTIEQDPLFLVLLRRQWGLIGAKDDGSPMTDAPLSARGTGQPPIMLSSRRASPMADRRPPAHSGPSAYSTSETQQHRRFMRKEDPLQSSGYTTGGNGGYWGASPEPPMAPATGYSPITKSQVPLIHSDADSQLGVVVRRFQGCLARRGLGALKSLADKFADFDHRKNGGIMKMDFERLNKSLGLGLSPDDRDVLFKGFAAGRKDGAMDYRKCMSSLKDQLTPEREALVENLFENLQDGSGTVSSRSMKVKFIPEHTPSCMLRKKDPKQVLNDFYAALEYFSAGQGGVVSREAFEDFFCVISTLHPEEHEFQLMTTSAFGLQG